MSVEEGKCPRCYALVADADLTEEPVTYERILKALVTEDDKFVFGPAIEEEDGTEVWLRQDSTKRICKACQQELGKFGYARKSTSYSGKYKAADVWIRQKERELAHVVCRHRIVDRTVQVGGRMLCPKCIP